MTDDLGDRLQRLAGDAIREDVGAFDAMDPLHVDAAARHLLARFLEQDDPEAFELLVEVTEPHVTRAAEAIIVDQGAAFPADHLIEALYRRIALDLSPRPREVRHFLNDAAIVMTSHAHQLIEEIASRPLPSERVEGDTTPPASAILDGPGTTEAPLTSEPPSDEDHLAAIGASYTNVVNICFHRLDVRHRRVLRACDVEYMTPADIGEAFGMSEDEALAQLRAARRALNEGILMAYGDGS